MRMSETPGNVLWASMLLDEIEFDTYNADHVLVSP